MKKKTALAAAAVALVGMLAVGGTLAWFTDTETATNVVTVGSIDVTLSEEGGADDQIVDGKLTYENVMPGSELTKKVTIENVGDNDAYVKAVITVIPKNNDSKVIPSDLVASNANAIKFDGNVAGKTWKLEGDNAVCTLYYSNTQTSSDAIILEKDKVWTLFQKVQIPESWGNAYENMEFDIQVDVYAIQADNFDSVAKAFEALEADTSVGESKSVDLAGTIATSSNAAGN